MRPAEGIDNSDYDLLVSSFLLPASYWFLEHHVRRLGENLGSNHSMEWLRAPIPYHT